MIDELRAAVGMTTQPATVAPSTLAARFLAEVVDVRRYPYGSPEPPSPRRAIFPLTRSAKRVTG